MSSLDPVPERVEVSSDVIFRQVGDELVLVRIATNEIFSLNPVGARIWELLNEDGAVAPIVARLTEEYEAPTGVLETEVAEFVAELRRQGFLVPA